MIPIRIIARLDIKGFNVIKGVQFEGLRIIGEPASIARKYYDQGADELLYIDTVASLYERQNLIEIVKRTSESGIRIPLTVGGGVRTIDDIRNLLHAGADKVAINTAAVKNPRIIVDAIKIFGSQCIVGSIEAKRKSNGDWEAYIDNGRESTGVRVVEWAKKLENLGVGELLLTSVDFDGTKKGFDYDLIDHITKSVSIPIIASGGAGKKEDIVTLAKREFDGAIAIASMLHYDIETIKSIKRELSKLGIQIRVQDKPNFETKKKHNITISILDYGAGNIHSVNTALKEMGYETRVIFDRNEILDSSILLIPGDGAFSYAMNKLAESKMINYIKEHVNQNKPLIGICLGMQLLMDSSDEFGHTKGLELIAGKVLNLKRIGVNKTFRIPHMGWNKIHINSTVYSEDLVEKGQEYYYFEHSYGVVPDNEDNVIGISEYGGARFCSVIKKNNIIGFQFHPEKSGASGMRLLERALRSVI